jgi:long-subunit acyl-CoA synthetase (AMP-forming)
MVLTLAYTCSLRHSQTLQTVVLDPDEWTAQNGLVTAAQKLNRKGILEKHKDEVEVSVVDLDQMYT